MRLLSDFAHKCIRFHLQLFKFENFFLGRNSQTPAYKVGEGRGEEGINGFLPLKKGMEGKDTREAKRRSRGGTGEGEGPVAGGIFLQGFKR